ncbi:MAG: PorT family protein [Candidatus Amulumruptor caecigallinarius]|nr:PorT family protein [Candidatus Amulumruptor caecigallinarius]
MKGIFKIIFAVVIMSVVPVAGCYAQSHYKSRISIGVHGGIDMSQISFTPSVPQKFNLGLNAGLNFRYVEEKHFGFIVEANFEQRGWKEDFEDLEYSYSRKINYIQIPFLAHIYFGSRYKFFINAGPSVSFRIGESTKSNFDYRNADTNPNLVNRNVIQMNTPVHQKVDYGITGGIGGEMSLTPRHSVYIDARFYYGLGNVLKSGRTDPIRGSNAMTISVSVGYWFRFK